ncbi:MAG: PAS domain-containing sensor histidine kinase [Candidatus Thorarchaeota archaeon]
MDNIRLFIDYIEGTNDLIHCVLPDGGFEFVNRSWLETLGYSETEATHVRLNDIIFDGHRASHQNLIDSVFQGKTFSNIEVTFKTKTGEVVYCEGNLVPQREEQEITAVQGYFRNITERKIADEQLREAKTRTDFFVDLMVHDITNIFQELLSTLEILHLTPEFPSHLTGFVNEGLSEIERASHLIGNVRKITRLYAKRQEQKILDLAQAISRAATKVENSFPEKQLMLSSTLSYGQHFVVADDFLDDIFYSLFHNSLKNDTKDRVHIEVYHELVKFTPFIKIHVKDHGPGITHEEKEGIFIRLSRRRDSIMGLGLGLTLVNQIIENYGGYITVQDSVEGDHTKGTTFTIILLCQQPEQVDDIVQAAQIAHEAKAALATKTDQTEEK